MDEPTSNGDRPLVASVDGELVAEASRVAKASLARDARRRMAAALARRRTGRQGRGLILLPIGRRSAFGR